MAVRIPVFVERLCLFVGACGFALVAVVYLDSFIGANRAVAAFEQNLTAKQETATQGMASRDDNAPLALLSIDRLDLEVPVFLGTDRVTLNRGAGVIAGTSLPGESGNVVISAHRDSFFRPLKDLAITDVIELRTELGIQRFQVEEIFITDPLDVSVLEPTTTPTLTLITCHPFYYVGFAPDRYIVRAVPIMSDS